MDLVGRRNFSMSKKIDLVCNKVCSYIQKQRTHMRSLVNVDKHVAVILWRLATNVEYRTLSEVFCIGHSTVCNIVAN